MVGSWQKVHLKVNVCFIPIKSKNSFCFFFFCSYIILTVMVQNEPSLRSLWNMPQSSVQGWCDLLALSCVSRLFLKIKIYKYSFRHNDKRTKQFSKTDFYALCVDGTFKHSMAICACWNINILVSLSAMWLKWEHDLLLRDSSPQNVNSVIVYSNLKDVLFLQNTKEDV